MCCWRQVGPLQVFVSKHSISKDMRFEPQSNPPRWVLRIPLRSRGTRPSSPRVCAAQGSAACALSVMYPRSPTSNQCA